MPWALKKRMVRQLRYFTGETADRYRSVRSGHLEIQFVAVSDSMLKTHSAARNSFRWISTAPAAQPIKRFV
jgi:hypothetical protein